MFERRHVVPILMAFYDSQLGDHYTRQLVLQVLSRIALLPAGLYLLVTRHSLLAWIRAAFEDNGISLSSLTPLLWFATLTATALAVQLSSVHANRYIR